MLLKSQNKLALTAAGFLAGVTMTVATIGGTASPVGADQAENAYMIAQKAQVASTTFQLDKCRTARHGCAGGSRGRLCLGALGAVRRARIAVQATDWPEPLKAMASEQVEIMKGLEEAIRSEDASKVVRAGEGRPRQGA